MASIKKRPKPTSISHDSVGTDDERKKKKEESNKIQSLTLTEEHVKTRLLSPEDMRKWGYMLQVPDGLGGDQPAEEGNIMECERCKQQFKVKRREEANECVFHWGRLYTSRVNGTVICTIHLTSSLP